MTVAVNPPDSIELAYAAAAEARGVSIEELVNDVLLSNLPVSPVTPEQRAMKTEWIQKQGIPVLRSGQPLSIEIVNETIDLIRRERELDILGRCGVLFFLDTSVLVPVFIEEHPHHELSLELFVRCQPPVASSRRTVLPNSIPR